MTAAGRRRVLAVSWALVIFLGGVLPTSEAVDVVSAGHDTAFTAAAHFLVYAVLGLLLAGGAGRRPDARTLLVALALCAALGGAVELVQGVLSYRDAQAGDFVLDVVGAAAGLAVSVVAPVWQSRSRLG